MAHAQEATDTDTTTAKKPIGGSYATHTATTQIEGIGGPSLGNYCSRDCPYQYHP
jgi:hypothetical protein